MTRKPPVVSPAAVRVARLCLEADASKAVRELGMPQTPVDVALREALDWFAARGRLGRRARSGVALRASPS